MGVFSLGPLRDIRQAREYQSLQPFRLRRCVKYIFTLLRLVIRRPLVLGLSGGEGFLRVRRVEI